MLIPVVGTSLLALAPSVMAIMHQYIFTYAPIYSLTHQYIYLRTYLFTYAPIYLLTHQCLHLRTNTYNYAPIHLRTSRDMSCSHLERSNIIKNYAFNTIRRIIRYGVIRPMHLYGVRYNMLCTIRCNFVNYGVITISKDRNLP